MTVTPATMENKLNEQSTKKKFYSVMYSDGLLHQRGFPKGLGTSQFSLKEQGILFFYQLNGY